VKPEGAESCAARSLVAANNKIERRR